MAVLIDFQACRGCLAPNINGAFTSLFENPENAARFDAIAEVSIADDKDDFAALICDSCLDEMTQAFELRRNLRFLEKISFETRRVKNDLQEVGSSIDKSSRKSGEKVAGVSTNSMSNNAQVELPRLREFYVRIERLEAVGEKFDQPCVSNVKSKPAEISKSLKMNGTKSLPKMKTKELENETDRGCHKNQFRDGQASNLIDVAGKDDVPQSRELNNHKMMPKDSRKSIKCQICHKLLMRMYDLKRHLQNVHQKIKNFACQVCEKKFGQESDLKRHVQVVHDKIKNFKCDLCDFKSSTKRYLHKHIARHLKNPNYKLRLHDTSNSNRPFKCSFENCEKFFKTKWQLIGHKKTHSDSRPFICPTCFKGFKTERYLKIHQKNVCGEKVLLNQ